MNFSTLSSNEKLAVYGAIAGIIGTLLTVFGGGFYGGAGGLWLTLLLAIAMLAIVFMPQWSPNTSLPGSKGSLMLVVGAIAGIGALLGLLVLLPALGFLGLVPLYTLGLLLGIAGGLMMGWAGWQEFQAEGGKFQLGTAATTPSRPNTTSSATPQGGGTAAPTATRTEGMGSTGPASTTAGSTSAGSTDMGAQGSAGAGENDPYDENRQQNP